MLLHYLDIPLHELPNDVLFSDLYSKLLVMGGFASGPVLNVELFDLSDPQASCPVMDTFPNMVSSYATFIDNKALACDINGACYSLSGPSPVRQK